MWPRKNDHKLVLKRKTQRWYYCGRGNGMILGMVRENPLYYGAS